jgi:hypothetical protein
MTRYEKATSDIVAGNPKIIQGSNNALTQIDFIKIIAIGVSLGLAAFTSIYSIIDFILGIVI